MNPNDIDLLGQDVAEDVESLPDGNALGCFSTTGCASTSSCPASTAGSASTYACLG